MPYWSITGDTTALEHAMKDAWLRWLEESSWARQIVGQLNQTGRFHMKPTHCVMPDLNLKAVRPGAGRRVNLLAFKCGCCAVHDDDFPPQHMTQPCAQHCVCILPDLGILFRTGPADEPTYHFACGCRFQSGSTDYSDERRYCATACGRDHHREICILHGFDPNDIVGDTLEWIERVRRKRPAKEISMPRLEFFPDLGIDHLTDVSIKHEPSGFYFRCGCRMWRTFQTFGYMQSRTPTSFEARQIRFCSIDHGYLLLRHINECDQATPVAIVPFNGMLVWERNA